MSAREFWDDATPPVRAVVELANLDDAARRSICAGLLPAHVEAVERLASLLTFIHRVSWDDPRRILSDYFQYSVGNISRPDEVVDAFAQDRRYDVLLDAAELAAALPMKAAA